MGKYGLNIRLPFRIRSLFRHKEPSPSSSPLDRSLVREENPAIYHCFSLQVLENLEVGYDRHAFTFLDGHAAYWRKSSD